jgi:hypothetical protein
MKIFNGSIICYSNEASTLSGNNSTFIIKNDAELKMEFINYSSLCICGI